MRMQTFILPLAACLAIAAASAKATVLDFAITGDANIDFQLTNPVAIPGSGSVDFANVPMVINGSSTVAYPHLLRR
jgi:hypothetical protein